MKSKNYKKADFKKGKAKGIFEVEQDNNLEKLLFKNDENDLKKLLAKKISTTEQEL